MAGDLSAKVVSGFNRRIGTLVVVGVGLIGGSIGLAVKRRGLADCVLGVGRNPYSLETARALGSIDQYSTDMRSAVAQAELAVFCTPVDQIVEQVRTAADVCAPGTLLTDAGSAKAAIVSALEAQLPTNIDFVGSHPLAGSEKRGPEHADADLFQGRVVVVTPTARTRAAPLQKTIGFWQALGADVHLMDPAAHDQALAFTSHLPHLIASALAGIVDPELFHLAASGFRDTTRVASGDPALWKGIFLHNRLGLLNALQQLMQQCDMFRSALSNYDAERLVQLLKEGKRVRDALGS